MFDRIIKVMARWYFRNMYQPVALDPQQPFEHPDQHHLDEVVQNFLSICFLTVRVSG